MSLTLVVFCFFDNNHPNKWEVAVHWGFDLNFSDDYYYIIEHLFIYLLTSIVIYKAVIFKKQLKNKIFYIIRDNPGGSSPN